VSSPFTGFLRLYFQRPPLQLPRVLARFLISTDHVKQYTLVYVQYSAMQARRQPSGELAKRVQIGNSMKALTNKQTQFFPPSCSHGGTKNGKK
jgi:hypothetical protein